MKLQNHLFVIPVNILLLLKQLQRLHHLEICLLCCKPISGQDIPTTYFLFLTPHLSPLTPHSSPLLLPVPAIIFPD